MSLLDALLLEGYRDPRDVYLALRSDGQRGSGSVDDPFHCGVVEDSSLSATLSLVVGTNPREILVTTASAHGYLEGDIVVLSSTRDATGAPAPSFDGPYYIIVADLPANQFKCYLDTPAAASLTGVAVLRKRVFLLDRLLRNLTRPIRLPNLAVHFGPGVYETRGTAGAFAGSVILGLQGWEVGPGWKIRGSGIEVTTVRLASARGTPSHALVFPIGIQTWYELSHYAEVSDLTVDCNAEGNRFLSMAAVYLTGSHIRVRRVRAINWGPQAGPESFVIALGGFHPALPELTDCVIEDCIAEQPGLNNNWTSTILSIVGTGALPEEKPAFFRGGAIRRCFVDATYTRNEVPIESITKTGSHPTAAAHVTTKLPHNRKAGDWVFIAGAHVYAEDNPYKDPLNNPYNGSYQIAASPAPTATTFSYILILGAGQTDASGPPVGEMFVDRFPSHYQTAGANSIVKVNPGDPNDHQYRLITPKPHNRIPGNNLPIDGVYVDVPLLNFANALNDSHPVDEVISPTELKFTAHPTALRPTGTINWVLSQIQIGVSMQIGAGGCTCQAVEHNRVIGATMATYNDTWSTKSLHIRNNHFHRVGSRGAYRLITNYLSPPPGPVSGSCLTYSYEGGKHIATYTSIEPHGLSPGGQVAIGGAFVSYYQDVSTPYTNVYNGTFTVLAVPSPNQFQYELSAAPPGYGTSANVPTNAGGSPVFSAGVGLNVITAQSLGALSPGSDTARFISQGPHGFNNFDVVAVFGVKLDTPTGGTFFNPYNGVFVITKVSDTEFTYKMASAPSAGALTSPVPMCAKQVGTALTRNGPTATYRTVRPHFLEKGQIVRVDNALVGGSFTNAFNGERFTLISVAQTSFTYEMTGVPATHAYGAVSYAGKDYEGLVQIENNVIELLPQAVPLPAGAIVTGGGKDFRPNSIFRQVAIRGNLMRNPDNMLDFAQWSFAMACYSCGTLLIENNVLALERTFPIWFDQSGMVSCVNNRTPQGALIKASNRDPEQASSLPTARLVESYSPTSEDAFVLAF